MKNFLSHFRLALPAALSALLIALPASAIAKPSTKSQEADRQPGKIQYAAIVIGESALQTLQRHANPESLVDYSPSDKASDSNKPNPESAGDDTEFDRNTKAAKSGSRSGKPL